MPNYHIKKASRQKIQKRRAIDDVLLNAQQCFANENFVGAILHYGLLVRLIEENKHATDNEKGDAYWNLAMSNIRRANQLTDTEATTANIHYQQARLQVRQALLSYSDKDEIKACNEKLIELGDLPFEPELPAQDIPVVEQKQPVLHWKKILLQRFKEEQAAANVDCTTIATASKRPI